MAKIEASVMIDRPVEEVWRFMTDLSNTQSGIKAFSKRGKLQHGRPA